MTTIDHAAEALDHIHSANIAAGHGEYASPDLEVKTAQAHATLALAEQQRIANLIAIMSCEIAEDKSAEFSEATAALYDAGKIRPDVKKGLRL